MSEVFLGQIMTTAFNFAPRGFALCNGQLMPISQNTALFSLLGTQYGGDGRTTFALPNLQGRVPVGALPSADPSWQPAPHPIGEAGGVESVTLIPTNLPSHSHQLQGTSAAGTSRFPLENLYGANSSALYAPASAARVPLAGGSLAGAGNSQPHQNMQPYQVINFCIALQGIFPSRS
ncbi:MULTISPECIES: phage tail protein [unclassified Lysobacter]